MKSNSASEKNIDNYTWHTFKGKKKVKLTNKNHVMFLAEGSKYAIRPMRTGTEHAITFENNLKVDFRVSAKEAQAIERKSTKARPPRNLKQKLNAVKNKRVVTVTSDRTQKRQAWDADRYQGDGKRLPSTKTGIDLKRFQWRKVEVPALTVNKTDRIKQTFNKGDQIGLRFDSPARGGLVVDPLGNSMRMSTEMYDFAVENSKLIPKNKWPTNKLTAADIAENKKYETQKQLQAAEIKKQKAKEERDRIRQERLALRKKQKAEKAAQKLKDKQQVEEYKKGEAERLEREQETIRKNTRTLDGAEKLAAFLDSSVDMDEEEDHLKDLDLDSSGKPIEPEEDDSDEEIEEDSPEEPEEEDSDLEDEDEDSSGEEEEEPEPDIKSRDIDKKKLNSELEDSLAEEFEKQKSDLGFDNPEDEEPDDYEGDDIDLGDEDEEDPDDEDLDDYMDEDDESEEELDVDEDEEDDLDDEEPTEEEDSDPDDDEEDSDPDDDDDDDDEEDSDPDDEEPTEEDLDEDEEPDVADIDGEEDEDVKAAEEAEKESKDKKGDKESEKNTEDDYEPKLADIVNFKRDKTDKRDFMLLDKYDLKNDSNITAYKFYDITNQPKTYQFVLIPKDKKMSIGKQVDKVRRGDIEEFRDYLKLLPNLEQNRDAITS